MISPSSFITTLTRNGINFFTGVPDSLLKNVCAYITDHIPPERNLITANEGTAVAVAAGHYLATSQPGLVYMQNSGIGNAVNPLLSLADEKVYSIPMVLLIGWRGEPGIHDEPQHLKQGEVTLDLLDTMGIPYAILPENEVQAIEVINCIIEKSKLESRPCALVVRKNTFDKYGLQNKVINSYPISRENAMKHVIDFLEEHFSSTTIVSTTGKLSRELFEYRESRGDNHSADFLTVGSMGHASSIALGIALAKPNEHVICFDGDGALIMHLGALTNIGALAPKNFIHILFNNGAHESVGGQPTLGFGIDILAIARACGYKYVVSVEKETEISSAISHAHYQEGPIFIEIKCGIDSRADLGRPTTTPLENRNALMRHLNNC